MIWIGRSGSADPVGKTPKVQNDTFWRVEPIVLGLFEVSNQIPIQTNLGTMGLTHPKVAFLIFATLG